jgi:putative component of membrane protein insertase Oxa1/YidC/SpoIIIJ protein YidD
VQVYHEPIEEENIFGLAESATRVVQCDPVNNHELPQVPQRNNPRAHPSDLPAKSKTKEPVPKYDELKEQKKPQAG